MSATATQTKVDATTKRTKAPASNAGVTNLGPKIDPFETNDPFDTGSTPTLDANVGKTDKKIHIRLQQRNGRKTVTTVQGLPDKYDPKKLLKAMKREFACNGHVVDSAESSDEDSPGPNKTAELGRILQFSGDQRLKVKEFLIATGIFSEKEVKDLVVVHGY